MVLDLLLDHGRLRLSLPLLLAQIIAVLHQVLLYCLLGLILFLMLFACVSLLREVLSFALLLLSGAIFVIVHLLVLKISVLLCQLLLLIQIGELVRHCHIVEAVDVTAMAGGVMGVVEPVALRLLLPHLAFLHYLLLLF